LNSKVSADVMQGCLQALNLPHTGSIIGGSTAQHMIRTVVLIHLGAISSVAHPPCYQTENSCRNSSWRS
jgi:hypothetical protein